MQIRSLYGIFKPKRLAACGGGGAKESIWDTPDLGRGLRPCTPDLNIALVRFTAE